MPVDFPRRAVSDDPDDIEPYVARRSLGFTPADQGDQLLTRPARAERLLEPTATIPPEANQAGLSPRPRRASFAEPLTSDADEEKSTATEAGIGRRAIDPFAETIKPYASRAEDAIPVQPQSTPLPPPSSPPASRALPPVPESYAVPSAPLASRAVPPTSPPPQAPLSDPAARRPSSPLAAAVFRPATPEAAGTSVPAPSPMSSTRPRPTQAPSGNAKAQRMSPPGRWQGEQPLTRSRMIARPHGCRNRPFNMPLQPQFALLTLRDGRSLVTCRRSLSTDWSRAITAVSYTHLTLPTNREV